ncbi:uncharacterized protein LOC133847956 [Drosophila sulfurigaster albostrigata]|uniref:uncharacterized protein LOC133847956 n=1 Tax=Drosophila sulfurigaster albostrigata TaxID=89887 RepID=UPI002D219DD7|nr:uncharacterized protein LOC133847956 [Drosophila sulfurigaster albostrigata]
MSDDKPFNPFYIGPHPSMACAPTETSTANQCTDTAKEEKQDAQSTAATAATAANGEVKPCDSEPCKEGEAQQS